MLVFLGFFLTHPVHFFPHCGTGNGTQGLAHARQVLCLLSHTSSPFVCILFMRHIFLTWPGLASIL
jgi:hypothetical protein